jgi:outer membrane assembly lipoprotein YfiO
MKKLFRLAILVSAVLFTYSSVCYSAWIWTPEAGRWFNPKGAVKDTAQEQLTYAANFYEEKSYKRAVSEYNKLVQYYPNSQHAPIAQYYIGRCYEDMESYFRAFLEYQKVIEAYPHAKNREEIIMRQHKIGVLFFDGRKAKVLGLALLPATDKAIEIFDQVIINSPYGEYADKAQFKIGESYKKSKRFAEAVLTFQELINNYPTSDLVESSNYEVAQCGYLASLGYSYDQETTDAAIEKFEDFVAESGDGALMKVAKESLNRLRERKAQGLYDTAGFYEKTGQHLSAVIYYKELVDKYPESSLAAESLNKIMKLEKRLEKKKRKGKRHT